jgi:hypothetical protein
MANTHFAVPDGTRFGGAFYPSHQWLGYFRGHFRRQMVMDKKESREYNPFMPFMIKRILRQNE